MYADKQINVCCVFADFFFLQNCLVKANLDFKVGTRITRTLQQKLAILLKTTIKYVNYFMT